MTGDLFFLSGRKSQKNFLGDQNTLPWTFWGLQNLKWIVWLLVWSLVKVLNRVTKIEIFEQPVKSGFDQLIRVENDNRSSANVKGEYVTIPRKFKMEVVYNKAFWKMLLSVTLTFFWVSWSFCWCCEHRHKEESQRGESWLDQAGISLAW